MPQVGEGQMDHNFWGRPEDMTMARPAWYIDTTRPGSDLAGEISAAFAAGYLLFRDIGKVQRHILCMLCIWRLYRPDLYSVYRTRGKRKAYVHRSTL